MRRVGHRQQNLADNFLRDQWKRCLQSTTRERLDPCQLLHPVNNAPMLGSVGR